MKKFFSALALLVLAVGLNAQNVYPNVQRNGILTSGRVPIVTTSGLLVDSASLTFNGTLLTAPTLTLSSTSSLLLGTAGSAVGNIGFRNATSGTATLAPPTGALGTYTVTLPNAASTLPIFGQQATFAGLTAARTITLLDLNYTTARQDAAQTFTGIQSFTSPDFTTSVTTPSTTFTAFAGATTLMTIGGTGASASSFFPSTLDATSSTTGAIRTSGGISAAKAANFGTTLNVGGAVTFTAAFPQLNLGANTTTKGGIKLFGNTSGDVTLAPLAVAGTATALTFPATSGGLIASVTAIGTVTGAPSSSNFLRGDGTWATPAGSGTVTVVSSGSLTSTALVTGGGTTTLQTPSATATMDSSGNISTPGTLTVGNAATTAGAIALTQGTTASTGTTNITVQAPTSVVSYVMTLPGAVGAANTFLKDVAGNGVLSWATVTSGAGTFTPNAQTGTTYTLGSTDLTNVNANSSLATLVSMNNASSNTLTVPLNATTAFPVGTNIVVQQLGAGATAIAATGGVTINTPSTLNLGVQYSMVSLLKTATDTWQLGAASLPSGIAITSPVITTGLTASGSAANDFSGSTGTFKTSTGAVTIGSGTTTFTGTVNASGANNFDLSGGSGTFKTNTGAVTIGPGATTLSGRLTYTPAVVASGTTPYSNLTIPTDTGLTAATEAIGNRTTTGTRTWATTGTVALQRENYFAGPTYASAGASQTFTDAFTMYLDKPIAGTNAIFTRAHSLGIVDSTSAASSITGGLVVSTTLGTAATSVGIGGGNVNAGGLITGGTVTSTGALTAGSTSITGAAATTALTIAQTARTSGVLPYIKWTIPADTAQTTLTESPGLISLTGSRQWATGTVPLQRENVFAAPTYTQVGAGTFTETATFAITGAPISGTNASQTTTNALLIQAGAVNGAGTAPVTANALKVLNPTGASGKNYAAQIGTAGIGITNIRHGISGAMTAGAVTVTDTGCTANTRYFFTTHTLGTVVVPSAYYASTRTAATSFVITSSQATDTSTVDWMAIEP